MLPGSGDCSTCRGAAAPPTLPLSGGSLWARVVNSSVPIVVGSAGAAVPGAARTTSLPPVSIPAFLAATTVFTMPISHVAVVVARLIVRREVVGVHRCTLRRGAAERS